jgi:hypothetical protein
LRNNAHCTPARSLALGVHFFFTPEAHWYIEDQECEAGQQVGVDMSYAHIPNLTRVTDCALSWTKWSLSAGIF